MSRQLFTAADIRRMVYEQKSSALVLGVGDIITPEAMDQAAQLGLQIVRETAKPFEVHGDHQLPLLKVVHRSNVVMENFGEHLATPGTHVRLKDVVTSRDGAPMAAGYMALEKGELPWTLTYDEMDIVLDGELVITRGSEVVRGGPGDTVFIPKGSSITFGSPSFTRFVYVTFPADWNA
jgi:ethanolamine utilization protein EutQ